MVIQVEDRANERPREVIKCKNTLDYKFHLEEPEVPTKKWLCSIKFCQCPRLDFPHFYYYFIYTQKPNFICKRRSQWVVHLGPKLPQTNL